MNSLARIVCIMCSLAGMAGCGPPANEAPGAVADSGDAARLGDIQTLAAGIRDWHTSHGELPASLGAVQFEYSLSLSLPADSYSYEILGEEDYQLCTTFDAASAERVERIWQHGAGRHCYRLSPTFAQF